MTTVINQTAAPTPAPTPAPRGITITLTPEQIQSAVAKTTNNTAQDQDQSQPELVNPIPPNRRAQIVYGVTFALALMESVSHVGLFPTDGKVATVFHAIRSALLVTQSMILGGSYTVERNRS